MSRNVSRLYYQFAPINYELDLSLDAQNQKFFGTVTITGKKTGRPNKRITLHQKGLSVQSAKIVKHDKSTPHPVAIERINLHKKFDELRIHTTSVLYPGTYTIEVTFSGKITDPMTGLYPCTFMNNGQKESLLATQFESHHAREVFPCIDEPEAKATFDLQITAPKDDVVLSNMPLKKEVVRDNSKISLFKTTPVMSSYLLAFVVGKMHAVEGVSKNGIQIRTWSHINQPKKTLAYANEQAIKVIDFFEDYFDIPFPLPKCDQVALPDFESGAMENWGLITYREVALLTDPVNRSIASEQYVSMVIAHELSHQWFGNLVTMKWWDDLWLNESFASLMEHIALDHLHPTWHQWEQYVSVDVIASSNRDVHKDVQPVRVDVNHPDEIHTLFDPAIVYAKGGRLLKMLMDYIGETAFREGLKDYFSTHKYKNTTRDDLWTSLSKTSDKKVHDFMNPWLEQSGMPIVSVTSKSKGVLSLSQSRFLLDNGTSSYLWPIPLLANQPVAPDVFVGPSSEAQYDKSDAPLLNVRGSGHYVVHYKTPAQSKHLSEAIRRRTIPSEARINSLNDMVLLNKRGDLNLVDLIAVVRQCKDEPREAVWALFTRILALGSQLGEHNKAIEDGMKEIKYDVANGLYGKLGWVEEKAEDPNTKLLRPTVLGLMIGSENEVVINDAIQKYHDCPSLEELPSDLRGLILGATIRHKNDKKDVDRLIEAYASTTDPHLQLSISAALTHTKNVEVARRIIEEGLGAKGFVRSQDIFRWYAYLMRNRYTREQAWEWLTSSWDMLSARFGGGKSFDHFIVYSSASIHTKDWETKFTNFFEPKETIIALKRNIVIAKSEIRSRVAWHDRNEKPLEQYLLDR